MRAMERALWGAMSPILGCERGGKPWEVVEELKVVDVLKVLDVRDEFEVLEVSDEFECVAALVLQGVRVYNGICFADCHSPAVASWRPTLSQTPRFLTLSWSRGA